MEMNIEEELLREYSKKQTVKIAKYVGDDPQKFKHLINLLASNSVLISQRTSWVLSACTDQYPELAKPHLKELVNHLKKPSHDAVKRHILRMLQNIEIPKNLYGNITDLCFRFLSSSNEPVAIKVFAMTVLYNITQHEPDLKNELKILIEDQMDYESPAFTSRGGKILKRLKSKPPLKK